MANADRSIPQGSYDSIRELLVMTVNTSAQSRRRRRRMPLIAAATTIGLLGTAGVALAIADPAVYRNSNGVAVVNSQQLDVIYQGQRISQADLAKLQTKHLAMFTAGDVPSAKLGVMHAFDTQTQLDTYRAQYLASQRADASAQSGSRIATASPTDTGTP